MRTLFKAGLLAAMVWAGQAQSIFRKAPPDVEEALLARVQQFYSLYEQAKFRQAEVVVAEESRDLYYGMSKVPIRGFHVENIEWADDFQSAKVLVSCRYVTPRTATAEIYVPVTGNWTRRNGQWFLLIVPRTTSPWGPMRFDDPSKSKPEPFQRPTVEAVTTGGFRVVPEKLMFAGAGPGPVSRTVVISNNMPGPLRLEIEDTKLPGLALTLSDKTVPAKSQVTLQAKYNPEAGKLSGTHEIKISVQPINQSITIPLQFE